MQLEEYRKNIDTIDRQLLDLFQKRMDLVEEIARYKLQHDLEIFQPEREQLLLAEKQKLAKDKYKDYAKDFFSEVLKLSKEYQKKIIEE